MNFLETVTVYAWTFPVLAVLAASLSYCGVHLAARQKNLLSLNMAQGAELGTLLSIAALYFSEHSESSGEMSVGLIGAIGGAFLFGWLATLFQGKFGESGSNSLLTFWLIVFSGTQLLVALHPALEIHHSRVFVGDVSTLGFEECLFVTGIALIISIFLWLRRDTVLRSTFSGEVLGYSMASARWRDEILFILLTAVSTWAAGFLMTCAFLFIPTTVRSMAGVVGARKHIRACVLLSFIAAPAGFALSLSHTGLPSVPIICLTLAVVVYLSNLFVMDSRIDEMFGR